MCMLSRLILLIKHILKKRRFGLPNNPSSFRSLKLKLRVVKEEQDLGASSKDQILLLII